MTEPKNFSEETIKKANALIEESWRNLFPSIRAADGFEKSIVDQAFEISKFCADCDTRSLVIIAVSFAEDCIKSIFLNRWEISSRSDLDAYFGPNGPLNSLDQRFLIAKSIGWVSEQTFKEISTLRKIRNLFAHNHNIRRILDDPARSLSGALLEHEIKFCELPLEKADINISEINTETLLRMRIFCASILSIADSLGRSKLNSVGIHASWRGGEEIEWHLETDLRLFEACIRHCATSLKIEID